MIRMYMSLVVRILFCTYTNYTGADQSVCEAFTQSDLAFLLFTTLIVYIVFLYANCITILIYNFIAVKLPIFK